MKFTLFPLVLGLLSLSASAGIKVRCSGETIVTTPWFPAPLTREMIVTVDQDQRGDGILFASIGGDTMTFSGKLILDGSSEMVIVDTNGDIVRILARAKSEKKMQVRISFGTEEDSLGGTSLTNLNCK